MASSSKQSPAEPTARVMVFAPDATTGAWINKEFDGEEVDVRLVASIKSVLTALVDDPPPRAQILIADFDAMTPADVMQLHRLREGWFGIIIALGKVGEDLCKSLNIDRVVNRPLGRGVLRGAVSAVGLHRATTRIDKVKGPLGH